MIRRLIDRFVTARRIQKDAVGWARSLGVQVGEGCWLFASPGMFGSEPYLVKLGDHVVVGSGTRFVTHDGGVWVFRDRDPEMGIYAPIIVGNNVFVGINVSIMPGVTIGDNCVIGMGSIVTRDIPPGSVAAGVPARVIKTVEEYWESVKGKAFHLRSLSEAERRRILTEHFFPERAGAPDKHRQTE